MSFRPLSLKRPDEELLPVCPFIGRGVLTSGSALVRAMPCKKAPLIYSALLEHS